jgi:hypothetical protein
VISFNGRHFDTLMHELAGALNTLAIAVDSQTWQSQKTEGRPGMGLTWEIEDVTLSVVTPKTPEAMDKLVKPNQPWADVHFEERVSGNPLNPPPSHQIWPFNQAGNAEHLDPAQKFSHTYPERFWPAHAGHEPSPCGIGEDGTSFCDFGPTVGVRYGYGDLYSVVNMLERDPTTRQAYLPIWFPEDTGAMSGQRVPCTLGYHFRWRRGRLNCTYHMRSCDFLRHLRDDIYLAMRLTGWICDRLNDSVSYGGAERPVAPIIPGKLTMNIGSLHVFDGDRPQMLSLERRLADQASRKLMEGLGL